MPRKVSDESFASLEFDQPLCRHRYGVTIGAAVFDGETSLSRGAGLTGAADSKKGTLSVWLKIDEQPAGAMLIFASTFSTQARVQMYYDGSTKTIQIRASNASNTQIMFIRSTTLIEAPTYWFQVEASWDLAVPGSARLRVNGKNNLTVEQYADDTIDYTGDNFRVGSGPIAGFYAGVIGEFWYLPGTYIDIDEDDDTFRDAVYGGPQVLDSDGTIPGSDPAITPLVYHRVSAADDPDDFAINRGTGGGMTISGTLSFFGTSCSAELGVDSDDKCFNTRVTCPVPEDYDATDIVPLRFVRAQEIPLSNGPFIPMLRNVSVSPGAINFAGMESSMAPFGQREVVTAQLVDAKHSDHQVDPYRLERQTGVASSTAEMYDPYDRGTFWGKWLARNPYFTNYRAKLRRWYSGQTPEQGEVRHYFIDSINVSDDNRVTVKLKDLFTKVEARKSVYPLPSVGKLTSAISGSPGSFGVSPTGIGNTAENEGGYANLTAGYVRIGDECIQITRSGDTFTVVGRGALGTTASNHDADDLVQEVGSLAADSPHDHIYTLLTGYTGLVVSDIDKDDWDERMLGFPFTYLTYVTEPTPVPELVGELMEQVGIFLWPDTITGLIELRLLQPTTATLVINERDWIIERSLSVVPQESKRVSRAMMYFGMRNYARDLKEVGNFHERVLVPSLDSEGADQYGSLSLRQFFSRWIIAGGLQSATASVTRVASLHRDPPHEAAFKLFAYRAGNVKLTEAFILDSNKVQNFKGDAQQLVMVPFQVFEDEHNISVRARETKYAIELGDPGERNIYVTNLQYNLNIRTIHDSLFAPLAGTETVNFYVQPSGIIGSVSVSAYALDTGTWPAGVTLNCHFEGRVEGHGGMGGNGATNEVTTGQPGLQGGLCMLVRRAVNFFGAGKIFAGGGGGGGGGRDGVFLGLAGGGGAGINGGQPGVEPALAAPGAPGTADAGGAGGSDPFRKDGGAGGGPGLAGNAGETGTTSGGAGGAAGVAIDGVSLVTFDSPNDLDIRGSQIN